MLAAPLLLTLLPSATLSVGPGQTYAKPCDAIGAALPGDVIEVDASGNGTYDGDSCAWSTDNLTIRGVNGRASINAGGTPTIANGGPSNIAMDKGIFVIAANNATIENFELSGAVSDTCPHGQGCSNNGAGIRHQGFNLTVTSCYIHDNQDGILGNPPDAGAGTVLIQFSEFAHNGQGDGYSHNMYLGEYQNFTLQYSYSHESVIGHLVKSRAYANQIQYNLLADLADGTGSYEVDLPQGGLSYVIGNAIEQSDAGAHAGNPTIVSYSEEVEVNPLQDLYFINNTVVNDADEGAWISANAAKSPTVTLINNIFRGAGSAATGTNLASNWDDSSGDPKFADPSSQNYQLAAGSPCIDAGVDPGMGNGQSLAPIAQYVAPVSGQTRDNAHWDIGAFEFNDVGSPVDGGASATAAASTATSGATASTSGGTGTSSSSTGAASSASSAATSSATSTGSGAAASSTSGTPVGAGGATSGGATGTGSTTGRATTGSADGGTSASTGGCSCGSGGASSVLLLPFGLLLLRRRRRDVN